MKYKQLPEPHRSLLFRLVEIYKTYAEPSSGLITFIDEMGTGLVVHLGKAVEAERLGPYTSENLRFLEKVGYVDWGKPDHHTPWIVPMQEAFDYYNYSHYPAWRRRAIDVWDKTETHWLSLLFGLLGGLLSGLAASLLS
jgi:hypothetical protein